MFALFPVYAVVSGLDLSRGTTEPESESNAPGFFPKGTLLG